jgi:hypothetical protein
MMMQSASASREKSVVASKLFSLRRAWMRLASMWRM